MPASVNAFAASVGSTSLVKWAGGFVTGFKCVSRSKASRNAKENLGCISQGPEQILVSFNAVFAFIKLRKPLYCVLENVTAL